MYRAVRFTKVQGQEVYVYDGDDPLVFLASEDTDVSFTLILTKADLILQGDVRTKAMFVVADGEVVFEPEQCERNTFVSGIFIAQE